MSWANGIILWLLGGMAAMWLFAILVDSKPERDHDWLAERKRKITRNGFKSRMGLKP